MGVPGEKELGGRGVSIVRFVMVHSLKGKNLLLLVAEILLLKKVYF